MALDCAKMDALADGIETLRERMDRRADAVIPFPKKQKYRVNVEFMPTQPPDRKKWTSKEVTVEVLDEYDISREAVKQIKKDFPDSGGWLVHKHTMKKL